VVEVHEVRRGLELEIARLAALRRSDHDVARLRASLTDRRAHFERADAEAMLDADLAFHQAMAQASGNAVLAELYASFSAAVRASLGELVALTGFRPASQDQHEQLAEAVVSGDAAEAQRLAALIIDQIVDSVTPVEPPT
jgi:DNA-binding FadR family transcriptional regulator